MPDENLDRMYYQALAEVDEAFFLLEYELKRLRLILTGFLNDEEGSSKPASNLENQGK